LTCPEEGEGYENIFDRFIKDIDGLDQTIIMLGE
jgi:hypothetical protein